MADCRIKLIDKDGSIVCNTKYSSYLECLEEWSMDRLIEKEIFDAILCDVSRQHGVKIVKALTPPVEWSRRYYKKKELRICS